MSRSFMQEVLNQTITTSAVYSSGQLCEMLGRSDQLAVQILVDSVSSGPLTVTATLQHSNDGADNTYSDLSTVTSASISTTGNFFVKSVYIASSIEYAVMMGGFVRLKILTSTGTAVVRAIAIGRGP